jgi:outer membrane protein OmpA-like peptidoglycan-associated protein
MSSQNDDSQGVVFGVVFGAVALVLALIYGVIQHQQGIKQAALVAPAAAAPAADAGAGGAVAVVDADAASVTVENGVVKFYFASGKSELAAGANEALSAVVAGAADGKKVLVSGFHDASGDPAKNAELAKLRAFAVRDALVGLGVAQDRVELRKPEEATAAGPAARARRVEVTLE